MSIAAYKRTIRDTDNPRNIERRVLSQVTVALEERAEKFDEAGTAGRLAELVAGTRDALVRNQAIWLTFAEKLADDSNGLSDELRANLLSLAIHVDKLTSDLFGGKGKITPLIEINRLIIDGLGAQEAAHPMAGSV